jgi:hypothetical protein
MNHQTAQATKIKMTAQANVLVSILHLLLLPGFGRLRLFSNDHNFEFRDQS